ncbi:unnamed protein product [Alopecurus aequalis]
MIPLRHTVAPPPGLRRFPEYYTPPAHHLRGHMVSTLHLRGLSLRIHTLSLRIHTLHLHMLHLQVHAWIFNSKDSVAGNCKTGEGFWGSIATTFNSTSHPARNRTAKQLKDHWNVYNREVSLFNGYYLQEEAVRQSGADDAMVMKAAMARYENDHKVTQPFKRHHWWEVVRHEAKWKGQHGPGSGADSTSKRTRLGVSGEYTSSEATEEDERPTGRDRAKAAARKDKGKRKGKESSSSSTEVASKSFAMKNMMQGLVKAKLLKQWNKMRDRSTADMDEQDKRKHVKALRIVEKELGLEDDDDEEEED